MTSDSASVLRTAGEPVVGILDWSHLLEDFLDNIGVSFEQLRREMAGGWLFGYVDALRLAGVRSVMFFVSARVQAPWRFRHEPTGALVVVLPAPALYRAIRRRVANPYAWSIESAVGEVGPLTRPFLAALKDVAPYTSTPPVALARELRSAGCRALLCQEYENPRFDLCVLLGRLIRVPVFATFQGGDFQVGLLERAIRPLAVRSSAGLVAGGRDEVERVRHAYRLPKAKVARIFNPLDLAQWIPDDRTAARAALGVQDAARAVSWHGRVQIDRKGLDILLDAWSRLRTDRRDARLLLLGTGPDAPRLRRRIDRAGWDDVVWRDEYVSDREPVRRFLAAGDVYAFPSRHEGFPVAPIEAMACGLPVVAADAPGMRDILPHGEASGGVIVPGNDPGALAAELARLLDDDARRREVGRKARARALGAFSLVAIGEQLRRFLLGEGVEVSEGIEELAAH